MSETIPDNSFKNKIFKNILKLGAKHSDKNGGQANKNLKPDSPVRIKKSTIRDDDYQSFIKNMNRKTLNRSNISDKSEQERQKAAHKVDKIINAICGNKKQQFSNNSLGLDNDKSEQNLINSINKITNNLKIIFASPKETQQNCELVEKHYLDAIKSENENLRNNLDSLNSQIFEFKELYHKLSGEKNFLDQLKDSFRKNTIEYNQKSKTLKEEITKETSENDKLKQEYTRERLDKENIYRALVSYTNQVDKKLCEEFQHIYKSFNNQSFITMHKLKDEKLIEELLAKIYLLEKEVSMKNFEINNLNKLLPQNKKLDLPKINSKLTRQSTLDSNKDQSKMNVTKGTFIKTQQKEDNKQVNVVKKFSKVK
jgi:hypothetical protein